MCKNQEKIKVSEEFRNEDIDKRKEVLQKMLYRIIKNREESLNK